MSKGQANIKCIAFFTICCNQSEQCQMCNISLHCFEPFVFLIKVLHNTLIQD